MENKETIARPVYIVGTGPGAPDLLTVKAQQLLAEADLLFYDCLPAVHVLKLASKAEVIYMEKHPEDGEPKGNLLEEIRRRYSPDKTIVRLKSGDAMMFNGADVEARTLRLWGIPFEIIPGITAACAASNRFAIPTTELHKSNAIIHLIAFHIDDPGLFHDTARLFQYGATVALYMAYDNLDLIFNIFKQEGVAADIPVVIASMVSLANEDMAVATMDTVYDVINKREMLSPFVFFIGKHVTDN